MPRTGRSRTLPDRDCERCGTSFHPRNAGVKYCGRDCYAQARTGKPRGRYKPAVIKVCPGCGREFETGGGGRPPLRQSFCSIPCRVEHGYYAGTQASPRALEMGRTDAAWLAGLFDGEGSIVNTRRSQRGYSLRITITNTCRPLLERVREVTGTGKIVNQRNATERTKACWYWTCGSKNACNLLAQMRPWLIVKADKADAAIERERVREAARVT